MDVSLYFMEIDFCNFRIDYILSYYNGFCVPSAIIKAGLSQIHERQEKNMNLLLADLHKFVGYSGGIEHVLSRMALP